MKACVHVIKKDVGGLLDLLECLLALLWEVGMGWERVGQQEVCVRTDLGLAPPCIFLAKTQDSACQSEDAICVAQPARLLQNCTRINLKSYCETVFWLAVAAAQGCGYNTVCREPRESSSLQNRLSLALQM